MKHQSRASAIVLSFLLLLGSMCFGEEAPTSAKQFILAKTDGRAYEPHQKSDILKSNEPLDVLVTESEIKENLSFLATENTNKVVRNIELRLKEKGMRTLIEWFTFDKSAQKLTSKISSISVEGKLSLLLGSRVDLPALKNISVNCHGTKLSRIADWLGNFNELDNLELTGLETSVQTLDFLSLLPKTKRLSLSFEFLNGFEYVSNIFKADKWSKISLLREVESLDISGGLLFGGFFNSIAQNTTLKHLSIDYSVMTFHDCASLGKMKNIKKLIIRAPYVVESIENYQEYIHSAEVFQDFEELPSNLEELYLYEVGLSEKAMEKVQGISSLKKFHFFEDCTFPTGKKPYFAASRFLPSLLQNANMTEVSMPVSSTLLDDETFRANISGFGKKLAMGLVFDSDEMTELDFREVKSKRVLLGEYDFYNIPKIPSAESVWISDSTIDHVFSSIISESGITSLVVPNRVMLEMPSEGKYPLFSSNSTIKQLIVLNATKELLLELVPESVKIIILVNPSHDFASGDNLSRFASACRNRGISVRYYFENDVSTTTNIHRLINIEDAELKQMQAAN